MTAGGQPGAPRVGAGQVIVGSRGGPATVPQQHITALHRLSDPALADLDLEALLDELLSRIRDVLDVDTAAILLLEHESQTLVARAAKGLEEEVEAEVRVPLGKGFAGRVAAERVGIFIAEVDHAEVYNPILREKGVRSLLGVPLIAAGAVMGVLHVGTLTPRTFTHTDAAVLELAAARAAPAIERAQVFQALQREHRFALALQRSLLPGDLPELVDVEVAARYLPARDEVGGDWYDVVPLPKGRVAIAIGDVVGHGARAAARMGHLCGGLRAYALEDHSPAVVLQMLDRMVLATSEAGTCTAIYAVFEPETGRFCVASAGHPPPLLVTSSDARFLDVAPSPPLGARAFGTFTEHEFTLAPGEAVLLYTDGLVEVRGQPLAEGLEQLRVAAAQDPSPEALCARIIERLVPAGGAADDVAVVALRSVPVPEELALRLPADPRVLATIRRALRRWLTLQGATPRESSAIVLAGGEACSNAIEHAYGPRSALFDVSAHRDGADVVVEVRDRGRWRPARGKHRGRGIAMMRAMMDAVEHETTDQGTAVLMRRRIGAPNGSR